MNITEIEQALKYFSEKFPQEAVEQAMQQRQEITPLLLDSLDYVNENSLM